jgi:hypothetical protein
MESVGNAADKIIRFLVTHAHCSECGGRYRSEDVYVLEQTGISVWDLAAVCHECYTLSLVRAVVRPHHGAVPAGARPEPEPVGTARSAPLSELTASEVRHFRALPPVGVEDVLDVCRFLAEFDGDFRGLFGQEPDGE